MSKTPLMDRMEEASMHIENLILDHAALASLAFLRWYWDTQPCACGKPVAVVNGAYAGSWGLYCNAECLAKYEVCDLGHPSCEDHFHSIAYHTADCWCGETEATCTQEWLM